MQEFLDDLNTTYSRLHTAYETYFWTSNMGDHSVDATLNKAQVARDAFRADQTLKARADLYLAELKRKGKVSKSDMVIKTRLEIWSRFFGLYQTPAHALVIKEKVGELEAKVLKIRTSRKEGYTDPRSGAFVEMSENKMRATMRIHPDETIRKACFDAMEKLPHDTLDDYIAIVKGRNEFAQALGYDDFYAYKIEIDEQMTKKQLFAIFEQIYEKTKYGLANIRVLEKKLASEKPHLRKPWNFGSMMTGDFTKEEDPYFQFDDALSYWGRSFAAIGVDFKGGAITLDLLDRKGKYNNGFCHWPVMVHYKNGRRVAGVSNFTCNAVPGQVGSGAQGLHTLFHEGGHAAHLLNVTETEVCLNHEYAPQSVSWAETQSMFMDSISSSIEWKMRYARTKDGAAYPFDLYERKVKALLPLFPLDLMGIIAVVFFEKEIYECKHLTREFVLKTARKISKKYFDLSEDTLRILNIPHIYSWESSAYYHGYGLAELGVCQWREYFYKKYGYIVDNPRVGKEMEKVWQYGARFSSKQFIKMATGKSLSPDAFIREVTGDFDGIIARAKAKIKRLEKVPMRNRPVRLDAKITLVHSKKKIADNSKSFEAMDERYRKWLKTLS